MLLGTPRTDPASTRGSRDTLLAALLCAAGAVAALFLIAVLMGRVDLDDGLPTVGAARSPSD
jgi:hypothetical protein